MKKSALILLSTLISGVASANSDDLTQFGNIAQLGVPITAGAISIWKGDNEGFWQLAEGALYTAAATHTLKWAVNETRPDGSDNNSFPSGHTSAATQGAAYLAYRYGWEYGLPAYGVSALVGYSRIHAHRHYWDDVAAGALIGTGIQYMVTEMGWNLSKTYVAPYVDGKEVGIAATFWI